MIILPTRLFYQLKLDKVQMTRSGTIQAAVTVTNAGDRAGEETVQMYIQDLYCSVVRPVKELKGYQKILLNPGESREVIFTIQEDDLKYYTADMSYQAEAGEFTVYVGSSSKDVQAATFELRFG